MKRHTSHDTPHTVTLQYAKGQTEGWRHFLKDALPDVTPESVLRGFYIPISDILNLAQQHGADGVRAYLCMDPLKEVVPVEIKLVIVPVKDGKDIIAPPGTPDDSTNTYIYDFTQPCPIQCDPTSPLY